MDRWGIDLKLENDFGEKDTKEQSPGAVSIGQWSRQEETMNLLDAAIGEEYLVRKIETDDEELNAFLFSLGCYSGEPITVISRKRSSCVVSIKDGRYNIDSQLAEVIIV